MSQEGAIGVFDDSVRRCGASVEDAVGEMAVPATLMASMRARWIVLVCCSALVAGGCAFPAQAPAIVPAASARLSVDAPTVNIRAVGGEATRLWGYPKLSNTAMAEAVSLAVAQAGLFLPLVDRVADYQLEVVLVRLDQKFWGVPTRVGLHVSWSLAKTRDLDRVWGDEISTSHTASVGTALIGTKRSRLATEAAARENIRQAIDRMSALDL